MLRPQRTAEWVGPEPGAEGEAGGTALAPWEPRTGRPEVHLCGLKTVCSYRQLYLQVGSGKTSAPALLCLDELESESLPVSGHQW